MEDTMDEGTEIGIYLLADESYRLSFTTEDEGDVDVTLTHDELLILRQRIDRMLERC